MTKTFYRTGYHTPDPTKFGGIITLNDYYTIAGGFLNPHGSPIANHIISDWQFDRQCRHNIMMQRKGKEFQKQ